MKIKNNYWTDLWSEAEQIWTKQVSTCRYAAGTRKNVKNDIKIHIKYIDIGNRGMI